MVDDAEPLRGRRLHLFGIGGRGMAPLAIAAKHLGAEVSGCDRDGHPGRVADIERVGATVLHGHDPEHVRPGVEFVATSVAPSDHPEVRRAEQVAGGVRHRTDLLADVLAARPSIGVTGSHGKGTVTALAGGALAESGFDPLTVVGASVPAFGGVVRLGSGPVVAEVDDSDLTLARVTADVAVVTNLDDDHPYLPTTLGDAVAAVGDFVANARSRVIIGPGPRAERLAARASAPVWRYGRDFRVRRLATAAGETRIVLHGPDGARAEAVVRLVGGATEANAALAFAAALALGADPDTAARGLGTVDGIHRRMEQIAEVDGVRVFDDFGGKHPVNVRRGLESLRRHFPDGRIIALFSPYGPYLAPWGFRYARAFSGADEVLVLPSAFSPDFAAEDRDDDRWISSFTVPVARVGSDDEGVARAVAAARPGDVIVLFAQVNASLVIAHRVRDALAAR